jgi:hypothetical protein
MNEMEWITAKMNEWMKEGKKGWRDEGMKEWRNEQMKEKMWNLYECMTKQMLPIKGREVRN